MAPSYDVTLTRANGNSGDTVRVEADDAAAAGEAALRLNLHEHDDWELFSVALAPWGEPEPAQ